MRPAAIPYRLRKAACIALFVAFAASFSPLLVSQSDPLNKAKRKAATHHEIVMLLIKKKDYGEAAKEACKIFSIQWPDNQEPLLLKELIGLSDEFSRNGQAAISLHLLNENARSFRQSESQIQILKEKGFLYKSLKQDDKALECFSKAQALENKK
jgi:hypothetical protein